MINSLRGGGGHMSKVISTSAGNESIGSQLRISHPHSVQLTYFNQNFSTAFIGGSSVAITFLIICSIAAPSKGGAMKSTSSSPWICKLPSAPPGHLKITGRILDCRE